MFLIGGKIGKQAAHQLLYEISMEAHTNGVPLSKLLNRHPLIKSSFTETEIREAADPATHIGSAVEQADRLVAMADKWLAANQTANKQPSVCPLADSACGCRVNRRGENP